ncbi:anillin isoform X2 [Anguilla anguilla]|uniref:anillin isoform X2 n=1 Tax=Anguilla anguilla TaxID=7936 RepID=UPI0015B0BA90|nr:anillin isoform X2 [Anguilla anguilla]
MDPFTEKLLERTRARRENLQKKMADRPTPAGRQMAKRAREPLGETNGLSEMAAAGAPPTTKPSPSKRRCSSENEHPGAGAENREPVVAMPIEPLTDKKPPLGPVTLRPVSSLEREDVVSASSQARHTVRFAPSVEKEAVGPTPSVEKEAVGPTPSVEKEAVGPTPSVEREAIGPAPSMEREAVRPAHSVEREVIRPAPEMDQSRDAGPAPSGMKSRLQRLAAQRQHWDNDAPSDVVDSTHVLLSPMKTHRQEAIAAASVDLAPVSTETPVGRRGRLANLAAVIGSWEDDLAPPGRDNAQAQPGTACVPAPGPAPGPAPAPAATKPSSAPRPAHASQTAPAPHQAPQSPLKSARAGLPEPRCVPQVGAGVSSSPQKIFLSGGPAALHSGRALTGSPQKAGPSPVSASQTPPKSQWPARDRPSPAKPQLSTKPIATATATPLLKGGAGTTGVKSFLERFGERCQERSTKNSPSAPCDGSTSVTSVTPGTRLAQERLRNAQVVTATADLALKQKLERENELAQIRNRFQKANVWKNSDRDAGAKEQHSAEHRIVESPVKEEITAPPVDTRSTASTPSHKEVAHLEQAEFSMEKRSEESGDEDDGEREVHAVAAGEVVREVEMNVDEQNSSEVINQLFEGVLEESKERRAEEEEEEDEGEEQEGEEDALNISSMSLLTPLAETVAAVVKSPEMKLLTSTPAGSFCEKSRTPDSAPRPGRFQRARVLRAAEEEGGPGDEDQNLPYSIDAYRSTRIKETERPHVRQVIVRKEDVTQKGEEPVRPHHINVKQKMKALSNEMNLQQTVIHQASQALNCCTDQEHGKGSQVEAEAERLLLIATERRSALKVELDRLKGEGPAGQRKGSTPFRAQDDVGVSASKGSVTLQELRLPLKADFVCAAANKPESANFYFFVMIRAGAENTVATPLASMRSGLSGDALSFSTTFTLPEVSSDFEIDVEVYCLVQKRELCPDKRKKTNKSKAITPKRLLTSITKSGTQTPVVASPGGPNAVRTSNFTLVGSHKLTLASIGKNKFPLEKMNVAGMEIQLLSDMFQYKVPFLCPLEGQVYLRLQCEVGSCVQERGFLTMFEDVSGFGAWHRRWCVLSGYCISYWTYPNDEKCKNPIGRINLANCTSRKVEPASREFCARPNTFELITVRPQREDDRETLVSRCNNTMCVTKNWLSADTKDERNLWMQKLNQILVDLRMWQPDSCYRPL